MTNNTSVYPLSEDLLRAAAIVKNILDHAEAERDRSMQVPGTDEEKRQVDAAACSHGDDSCSRADDVLAPVAEPQERQRQWQEVRVLKNPKLLPQESHDYLNDVSSDDKARRQQMQQRRQQQGQQQHQDQQQQQQQQQHQTLHQMSGTHRVIASTSRHQQALTVHGRPSSRRPGRPPRKRYRRNDAPKDCRENSSMRESTLQLAPAECHRLHAQDVARNDGIDGVERNGVDDDVTVSGTVTSTLRVISSETYLRRLFVTASLAHVLSLDECLPRAMPFKRAASSRGNGTEGHGGIRTLGLAAAEGRRDRDGQRGPAGQQGNTGCIYCCRDRNGYDAGISGDDDDNAGNDRVSFPGSFKKQYPVTLIDSAGNRWSVTYVTTRRDNLHSGRLVDGWERFCSAIGLTVGDVVEFVRVESGDQNQGGKGWRREAVARVKVHRKQ